MTRPEPKTARAEKWKRYQRLARGLARTGLLLQGTITELRLRRPDPRRPGKQKTYGPYYQWTWKEQGKTVTRRLTPRQAKLFQQAIANHRRLEQLLQEMRQLSRQIFEASTEGVKTRKARKN